MKLKCNHCGHVIDPNADSTRWHPPIDPTNSMGAIRCPNCGTLEDFIEWKLLTADSSQKLPPS